MTELQTESELCPECGHPHHFPKECEAREDELICDCILHDEETALDAVVGEWDTGLARLFDFLLHLSDEIVRELADRGEVVRLSIYSTSYDPERTLRMLEMLGSTEVKTSVAGPYVKRSFGPHEVQVYLPSLRPETIHPERMVRPEIQAWIDEHTKEPDARD